MLVHQGLPQAPTQVVSEGDCGEDQLLRAERNRHTRTARRFSMSVMQEMQPGTCGDLDPAAASVPTSHPPTPGGARPKQNAAGLKGVKRYLTWRC